MIGLFKDEFRDISTRYKEIRAVLEEHDLWNKTTFFLTLVGCLLSGFAILMIPIALLFSFAGHVSFNPPSTIDPIYEAGFGFIFNRWFWRTMFLAAVMSCYIGYKLHPATILEDKIGKRAVQTYKGKYGWPWR